MIYVLDLDVFADEVFHYLETHQDGKEGHRATYEAPSADEALDKVMLILRDFVEEHLREETP